MPTDNKIPGIAELQKKLTHSGWLLGQMTGGYDRKSINWIGNGATAVIIHEGQPYRIDIVPIYVKEK